MITSQRPSSCTFLLASAVTLILGLSACGEDSPNGSGGATTTQGQGGSSEGGGGGSSTGGSAGGGAGGDDCVSDKTPEPGLVITKHGAVRGVAAGNSYAFKGIAYAAPPTGTLRWRPPEPLQCWKGEQDATSFGDVCVQHEGVGKDKKVVGSEDCLTLNVWAPKTEPAAPRAVMVFVHGGSNIKGSSSEGGDAEPFYDGQPFVEQADVVVVTINYRLGAFGFLAHSALSGEDEHGSSGNYALLDQLAALEWVRDNIAQFGGDPNQVMLFGQSAGAVNVCALLASPLAKGLLSSALMQSGACVSKTLAERETFGGTFASTAGCSSGDVADCLRGLSTAQIMAGYPEIDLVGVGIEGLAFGPTVDGHVLPLDPLATIEAGKHNDVMFALGSTANEASLFHVLTPIVSRDKYISIVEAKYSAADAAAILAAFPPPPPLKNAHDQLVALDTDVKYTCPTRRAARAAAKSQNSAVYRYLFADTVSNGSNAVKALGAFHTVELFYLFQKDEVMGAALTSQEGQLSTAMLDYWTTFAIKGDPNGANTVDWPAYVSNGDAYLELNETIVSGDGVRTAECDVLDGVTPL